MNFERSKTLQGRAHALIPGGCHTYAKGDDQYPEQSPGFLVKGRGCHVWDVDGNEFIEYNMGLRSVTLGYADERILSVARNYMLEGSSFTRPSPIEVECAEEMLSLIEGAEMVKFGKNGSDVTSAAIRLSRAYTGRDLVAVCADHPFFSGDDWFIGSTPISAGVPKTVQELTLKFTYNSTESVQSLFQQYPGRIACLIMEPEKETPPANDFIRKVQELCRKHGSVFILDEMICGFRWHRGGGQQYHKILPDLSTFGKALANGFSVSALVGKREIMRLGGLDHEHERVFLLSLTHGAEAHCLAAAKEVIRIYKREPVVETMWRAGERLERGVQKSIGEYHLQEHFKVLGKPCCQVYVTLDSERNPSQAFRTLFLQETIKRGILAPSFVVSSSHTDDDIDRTIEVIHEALQVYRKALDEGCDKYLVGRPVKPVFRRYV
ncbi:MAG TPA: glutamate-1-semialdehyde 2,1-aminomutase [Nitrospira sp.]|nr:glutamate-1-semialdehyde 2,1-aminomutase [Nitrospira sp.]